MLKPAILYKEELEKKFAAEIYDDRYYYYTGYAYAFEPPTIKAQDNHYQWAIVEKIDNFTDKVIGYLAYQVQDGEQVYNFGWYSFEEGNVLVVQDTYRKLEELVNRYHRVEWRAIEGNHAIKGYNAFCDKHNGNCVCLHDVCKDPSGNYRNEYIYEILKRWDGK